jgi:hypothetical protein
MQKAGERNMQLRTKGWLLLATCFVLFAATFLFDYLGNASLSSALFYVAIVGFFAAWVVTMKFVLRSNKRAYERLKGRKLILTDSLMRDEENVGDEKAK